MFSNLINDLYLKIVIAALAGFLLGWLLSLEAEAVASKADNDEIVNIQRQSLGVTTQFIIVPGFAGKLRCRPQSDALKTRKMCLNWLEMA